MSCRETNRWSFLLAILILHGKINLYILGNKLAKHTTKYTINEENYFLKKKFEENLNVKQQTIKEKCLNYE